MFEYISAPRAVVRDVSVERYCLWTEEDCSGFEVRIHIQEDVGSICKGLEMILDNSENLQYLFTVSLWMVLMISDTVKCI